ncbi:hypothetical protein [Egbenema bharatensis]
MAYSFSLAASYVVAAVLYQEAPMQWSTLLGGSLILLSGAIVLQG